MKINIKVDLQPSFSLSFRDGVNGRWRDREAFGIFLRLWLQISLQTCKLNDQHTSGLVCSTGGGGRGSFSSGIEPCTVPLTALDVLASSGVSRAVPFVVSMLGTRVCLGDSGGSGERGVCDWKRRGETGRSEEPGASRSLDLPLPNPLKAELRLLEDPLRSGEVARPYGCALCRLRPRTVPKRFRGFELCFSCTSVRQSIHTRDHDIRT